METITKKGFVTDNRGRKIRIVATDLPGAYPVLGVQITNKNDDVSKDGLRLYTAKGKFYSNGGRKVDPLDLKLNTFEASCDCDEGDEVEEVTLGYFLNGEKVAEKTVVKGSEEYDELTDDNWAEVEDEE